MNLLFGKGYPKPETNSEFTPENGCFEDFFVSFGGPADFQGLLLLVSGRVCWLSTWWDIYLRGGYLPNKLPQAPIVDESPPEMRRSLHLGWHHKATLLLQKFNHQQDNSSKKNAKKNMFGAGNKRTKNDNNHVLWHFLTISPQIILPFFLLYGIFIYMNGWFLW